MRVLLAIILIHFSLNTHASAEDVIVLPLNDWPSQRLLSKIVGDKIEQLGYSVEYLPISSVNQMGALRKGLVHLQVELWQSYDEGHFGKAVKAGYIEDLGLHTAIGREEWWYPEYVEQLCPELPKWQALKKCAGLFSDDNKADKGIYYAGPWKSRDAALIRALGMNFSIERLSNAEQLWQKLRQAIKSKQAIVLLNWSPNWIDVRIKGHFIEFPVFEKACEQDPNWGINKKMLYDCGNPRVTLIKKAAWPGVKHKWPCVYQLMKKIDFTNEMIAQASALLSVDRKTEQEAKNIWLSKYGELSKGWLTFTCPQT